VFGQNEEIVPDAATCPACRITVEQVVRLGPSGDLPTAPTNVVKDAKGRYWLTFSNELAMVFDADGRFVQRLREGGGPGEFRYPWHVITAGDSILVVDRRNGLSVLTPNLEPGRSLQRSHVEGFGIVAAWPDSVIINVANPITPDNVAPFHVVSFSGPAPGVVRSFGAERPPPASPRSFVNLRRIFVRAHAGGIWATEYQDYTIKLWSQAGDLRQVLVRRPDWFPVGRQPINLKAPPAAHIQALAEDPGGRLWVFASVAAPTWSEGYPQIPTGATSFEARPEAFANEKLFDTAIEIIDTRAARIVARATLDRFVVAHIRDDLVAIYDTTEDGEPFVDIVRLIIQQPDHRPYP
jgi:hypothetical protein